MYVTFGHSSLKKFPKKECQNDLLNTGARKEKNNSPWSEEYKEITLVGMNEMKSGLVRGRQK